MKNLRKIKSGLIKDKIISLLTKASINIDPIVKNKIKSAIQTESNPRAKDILKTLLKNYRLAKDYKMPICQDTGSMIIFLEVGQKVTFDGNLNQAIADGITTATKKLYLRKSIVKDPLFQRTNTRNNTPPIIHYNIAPGNKVKITVAPKGGGAENMSRIAMLKPTVGKKGLIDFVLKTVKEAGGNPCPPIIVGIGIGGNFETAALLAKKSLLTELDQNNEDREYAKLEKEILEKINSTGIGPQGLGGDTTALKVNILQKPCHIASLPVAVNLQCHAHRHASIVI